MEELSEEGAAEVAKLRSLSPSSPPPPSAACSPLGATRPGVGLFTFGVHVARCARVRQLDRRLLKGVVTRSDPCAHSLSDVTQVPRKAWTTCAGFRGRDPAPNAPVSPRPSAVQGVACGALKHQWPCDMGTQRTLAPVNDAQWLAG